MNHISTNEKASLPLTTSYENITGRIPYNMTNDYMFRAVLQKNHKVLTGLVCSLLHLEPSEIKSIKIMNPIKLGATLGDKEFLLDILVLLNNHTHLNLEMQVANEGNWIERSLSYLCRSFDELVKGQDYKEAPPVIHIGFLDYTLFQNSPEFYASYQMMNIKNHDIFSDKFQLRVVELNQIHLATEEDKQYGLDYWAYLFKAKTWEELKTMATKNEYLEETAKTLYTLSSDKLIQEACRRRDDYNKQTNYFVNKIDEQATTIAKQASTITKQASTITEQASRIAELEALLAAKK